MNTEKTDPLVSIILISYRDKRHLEQVLPLIEENTESPEYEIILIDNANPENIEKWVKNHYPSVQYYKLPRNLGFGRANNIGIKKARGKYIVCLNTDTFPQKGWLSSLVELAENDSTLGVVACPLLPASEINEPIKRPMNQIREEPQIEGACFLYRKALSEEEEIGLFDRFFFFYKEDADLSFRVWFHGYRVISTTSSIVYHVINKSDKKEISDKKSRYFLKSNLYFLFKYAAWSTIIQESAIALFTILTSLLLKRDLKRAEGKIKGFYDTFRKIGFLFSVRHHFQLMFPKYIRTVKKLRSLQYATGIYPNGGIFRKFWNFKLR